MTARSLSVLLLMLAVAPALAQTQPVLKGDINAHDPTWTEVDGTQIVYWTGENSTNRGAILAKTSPDGITWDDKGTIGEGGPAWIVDAIGQMPPNLWAPTVFAKDGKHYLYYAASIFGRNTSAIGLLTNDALDPAAPTEGWVDRGPVVVTTAADDHNAIDAARIDTADGRAWLVFGSYWTGIKLRELDPATGLLLAGTDEIHALASRNGGPIEAPSILEHDGRFYLFVSFDRCCRGTGSTYKIMVGRADAVTGPYLDGDGEPMMEGGGTLLLEKAGKYKGPGGQEAFATPEGDILVYHFYDQSLYGLAQLQISPIRWTDDGWPYLDPLPVP
jgi:arabinan endo-1,5-alpha-L-arabinosidase